jgi:hypothetical protein
MRHLEFLRRSFDECTWREPFHPFPEITDAGLVLGFGTVLARMACTRGGKYVLAVDADGERLLALMAAVCGRQLPPVAMRYVHRASEQLRQGDRVLAQIELAFACFPRLELREDAFRLFLAEDLLAKGFSPRRLTQELGFDPRLLKWAYDPQEPRVSAGHGKESGEWSSEVVGPLIAPAPKPVVIAPPIRFAQEVKCSEFITQNCNGSILREFPSQYLDVTVDQLLRDAQAGNAAARKAKKLLFDNRFSK